MVEIFISHSSIDQPIINSFVHDLLRGALSIDIGKIFCTTTDGTRIKSGDDWRNSIQEALMKSKVIVLIITPNYKESEVCMCEMGAAWVTSAKVIPFIVTPISYSSVGIIQQPNQVENLLDEKSLDRLKDSLRDESIIDAGPIPSDLWTGMKKEFLKKVNAHLNENPFHDALSRDKFNNALKKIDELKNNNQSLTEEVERLKGFNKELKKAKDLKEVKEIERKHINTNSMDEFSNLCNKVSNNLKKLSSIVMEITFVSYSEKNIDINIEGWKTELDEAISRDYITEDLDADWETTSLMQDIKEALDELENFLNEKDTDENFTETYQDKYKAPLLLSNMSFWEEAFEVSNSIS
jgi:TIR domain